MTRKTLRREQRNVNRQKNSYSLFIIHLLFQLYASRWFRFYERNFFFSLPILLHERVAKRIQLVFRSFFFYLVESRRLFPLFFVLSFLSSYIGLGIRIKMTITVAVVIQSIKY